MATCTLSRAGWYRHSRVDRSPFRPDSRLPPCCRYLWLSRQHRMPSIRRRALFLQCMPGLVRCCLFSSRRPPNACRAMHARVRTYPEREFQNRECGSSRYRTPECRLHHPFLFEVLGRTIMHRCRQIVLGHLLRIEIREGGMQLLESVEVVEDCRDDGVDGFRIGFRR